MNTNNIQHFFLAFVLAVVLSAGWTGCTLQYRATKASQLFRQHPTVAKAQIGICLFEPSSGQVLVNYRGDKNFIPGSTQKVLTSGLSRLILPDTLPVFRYQQVDSTLLLQPIGYPALADSRFDQPNLRAWINERGITNIQVAPNQAIPTPYAPGWSWDDYLEAYMPERSAFPINNNLISFTRDQEEIAWEANDWPIQMQIDSALLQQPRTQIKRDLTSNRFYLARGGQPWTKQQVPVYRTDSLWPIALSNHWQVPVGYGSLVPATTGWQDFTGPVPRDTIIREMMRVSDNALAEQLLLQATFHRRTDFETQALIDSLRSIIWKSEESQTNWVDGSGLSRYNLASPASQVSVLNWIAKTFGEDWLKMILPRAGDGTLTSYPAPSNVQLLAKTGSMSGVFCLTGILVTAQQRQIYFSIMTNGFPGKIKPVRDQVFKFLYQLAQKN